MELVCQVGKHRLAVAAAARDCKINFQNFIHFAENKDRWAYHIPWWCSFLLSLSSLFTVLTSKLKKRSFELRVIRSAFMGSHVEGEAGTFLCRHPHFECVPCIKWDSLLSALCPGSHCWWCIGFPIHSPESDILILIECAHPVPSVLAHNLCSTHW